jgi:hypothetical protein
VSGFEQNKKIQSLVFYSFFIGLLFPLRIFLNSILGDNWIGSFGILTVISIIFLYLAEKNKLGWYGRAFLNKFRSIRTSRKKYLIIGQGIVGIILASTILYLISYGNTIQSEFKDNTILQMEQKYENFDQLQSDSIQIMQEKPLEVIAGILLLPVLLVSNPDIVAVILAVEDNLSNQLFSHLFTIALLEEIEIIGIMIYYSKKAKSITFNN